MAVLKMFSIRCPRCNGVAQGILACGRGGKFHGFNCPKCGPLAQVYRGEVEHPLFATIIFDLLLDVLRGKRELTEADKNFILDFLDHPEKYPAVDSTCEESYEEDDTLSEEEFLALIKSINRESEEYWGGKISEILEAVIPLKGNCPEEK